MGDALLHASFIGFFGTRLKVADTSKPSRDCFHRTHRRRRRPPRSWIHPRIYRLAHRPPPEGRVLTLLRALSKNTQEHEQRTFPLPPRPQAAELARRLAGPRRFIRVVAGLRQVGKSTLVQQVTEEFAAEVRYASADEPTLRGSEWIAQQWEAARLAAAGAGKRGAVLVLDEIQKIVGWSETVKRLWDEDTRRRVPLKVVLLGSAPLLVARGMSESLAGRFELLHLPHWSYVEMRAAFGFGLNEFLYFGGYPGAAPLIRELEHRRARACNPDNQPTGG